MSTCPTCGAARPDQSWIAQQRDERRRRVRYVIETSEERPSKALLAKRFGVCIDVIRRDLRALGITLSPSLDRAQSNLAE